MMKSLLFAPLALLLIAARHAPAPPTTTPKSWIAPAAVAADPTNRWTIDLSNGGHVVIQLRPDIAPLSVQRIQQLTQQHFYDGLKFHRVIPGFMAQGGDPKGDGSGGSPLPDLKAEFTDLPHVRGAVAMARANSPDSANSQFYIMFGPKVSLDQKYTVIGRVIEGMAAVDSIAQGEPPEQPTTIVHATLGAPVAIVAVPEPAPAPEPAAPTPVPAPAPAAEVPAPK